MSFVSKVVSSPLARWGAVKLLSSPRARRGAVRLAKSPRVRRGAIKLAKNRRVQRMLFEQAANGTVPRKVVLVQAGLLVRGHRRMGSDPTAYPNRPQHSDT